MKFLRLAPVLAFAVISAHAEDTTQTAIDGAMSKVSGLGTAVGPVIGTVVGLTAGLMLWKMIRKYIGKAS